MANIYTKPVQSQFVPTYQPVNLDAINMAAQATQRRQEQNFQRYDQIQDSMREMEKNMFEQDKPLFNQRMGEMRSRLDELAADGDLSDAGRQIRSLATQFKDEATRGELGKAFQNFQAVQERYDVIDKSDLPDAEKEARKNAIIAGYRGAGQGGLDLSINTDSLDVNDWVEDTLGDIDPQSITRGTDWVYNSKISKFEKGEVTVEGIPQELITQTVATRLAEDPGAISALRQKARVQTAGQDEFVIGEGEDARIVSREEKMKQIINDQMENIVRLGQQKYGQKIVDQSTAMTSAGAGASGVPGGTGTGVSAVGLKRGQTFAKNVNITGFDDAFQEIDTKTANDSLDEASELSGSLQRAVYSWAESSEGLSESDADFLMNMKTKLREDGVVSSKAFNRNAQPMTIQSTGFSPDPLTFGPGESYQYMKENYGKEQADKYFRLKEEFNNWVTEGGGWTDKEYFLKDEDKIADINQFVQSVTNPNDWKIYGKGDADSTEFLSQDSGDGTPVMDTFQFQSVVAPNEYAPTMVSGTVIVEGEEVPIRLTAKRDPTAPSSISDPLDAILERYGGVGEEIKEQRKYEDIKPTRETTNVFDKLPSELRAVANNEYVGIKNTKRGFQVEFGDSSGEQISPFTVGDMIQNIYNNPPQGMDPREFIEKHNSSGTLTDEEIGLILDGDMTPEIRQKLNTRFTKPYEFRNKITALQAGARITR